jgi:hypothetical protein
LNRTDMLMRGLAEPYRGPSTMVKEGGVPANFRYRITCGIRTANVQKSETEYRKWPVGVVRFSV